MLCLHAALSIVLHVIWDDCGCGHEPILLVVIFLLICIDMKYNKHNYLFTLKKF
jgi:hypothetical protein